MAIDSPYSKHGGDISRDEWMARSLLTVLEKEPAAKLLVVVGNLITLKKLEWEDQVSTKNLSIREYIQRKRPSKRVRSSSQIGIRAFVDHKDF